MNPVSFYTLFKKEILRFWKVALQTVAAPVVSALLYQLIFSHVMSGRGEILPGVDYAAFLIPGLAMMSMLQNSFANASSSLIQSRTTGNLIFIQITPVTPRVFFGAYVGASVVRGLLVGVCVVLVTAGFGLPAPHNILWIILFAVLACTAMGAFGLLAGIVAEKYDQLAMFQNFLIMPLTFLSGVFYSLHSLPPFWQNLSRFNPMFYLIDGFRYGFFGVSDVSPWLSLAAAAVSCLLVCSGVLLLLKSGYKMRR